MPLRIYSADGALIGEFGEKRRSPVHLEEVPPLFVKAVLAAEDDRFYEHHGVDIAGLVRAATQLLASGRIQSGGSTITMQVAKNYFLSHERTFSRKFNEILLALQIERELTKDQILELYLNKIFLGNRAYGVEAAAQVYYGKSMRELDLAQWAMIAGLPKAPSTFNPLVNPQRAVVRRNWILGRMRDLGFIDQHAHELAVASPVTASYHGAKLDVDAQYAAEMARQFAVGRYGLDAYTDGYRVFTTVDSRLQRAANRAVAEGLFRYDERHGYRGPELQLAMDPSETREGWRAVLEQTPVIAGLRPAIVSEVDEQSFTALLGDGSEVEIGWDSGLSELRPYIDVNSRGRRPQTASDLVAAGDLVRLRQRDDGSWQLSQVPAVQGALVALDSDDGAILSLVGGLDYGQSKFNRVTQAARQPGSNFKPFIYSAALENGFTAASIINDAPIVFDDRQLESTWRPTNASGKFFGPTRLREALFKSRNLVSIRLLRELGIGRAIEYAGRFGFDESKLPHDLSLALGSHSLPPMEIVTGYAAFANGGYRVDPYLVTRVEDIQGEVLFEAAPATVCRDCDEAKLEEIEVEQMLREAPNIEAILAGAPDADPAAEPEPEPLPRAERIVEERVAYIMNSLLRDVIERGTGRRARSLNRSDLAGKTGTTNGPTDAWFSGYGGDVVATTWLGFDQNQLLGRREYGGSAALPMWIDFMQVALDGRPQQAWKQPSGIVAVRIDPETGLRAPPGSNDAIFEIFREENAPRETAVEAPDPTLLDDPGGVQREDIF